MWVFIIDIMVTVLTVLGVHRPELLERIIRRKISVRQKFVLLVAYWFSISILVLLAFITLVNLFFEGKVSYCSEQFVCFKSTKVPDKKIGSMSGLELCNSAINLEKNAWQTNSEVKKYIAEAKKRNITIDSCRGLYGMSPLKKSTNLSRANQITNMDDFSLCDKALKADRRNWDSTDLSALYYQETKRRNHTISSCRISLGLDSEFEQDTRSFVTDFDTPSLNHAPPVELIPQSLVNIGEGNGIELPLGTMRNNSYPYTNLRTKPGTKFGSQVIRAVDNGEKIIILGNKNSKASGHMYCRIMLEDGTTGFADHEMIDGNCYLTVKQLAYADGLLSSEPSVIERFLNWLK